MQGKLELAAIPLNLIRENPVALRAVNQSAEEFTQLVDSVKDNGILNPINVRRKLEGQGGKPDGKEYEIIDGLHRYTAATAAGLEEIPAQILEKNDAEALVAQVIGNVHKVETKPIEYTRGLLRILSHNPMMTQAELAAMLSVSPQFIDQRLSLTKLHPEIQKLVNEGQINLTNAFPLAKLPPENQLEWASRAMTMGSGEFVAQVQGEAKRLRDEKRKGREATPTEFQPRAFPRKLSEIKSEFESPTVIPALVSQLRITEPAAAAALALAWTLNMDPISQDEQRRRDSELKKKNADEKAKREAEKTEKRAAEAAKKQQELNEAAAKARAEADRRGVSTPAEAAVA